MAETPGILLVDDRQNDRALMEMVLRQGLASTRMLVPEDALDLGAILSTEQNLIAAVIEADLSWVSAASVVERIRARFPECLVIFYSAAGPQVLTPAIAALNLSAFYRKISGDLLLIPRDIISLAKIGASDKAPQDAEFAPNVYEVETVGRESEVVPSLSATQHQVALEQPGASGESEKRIRDEMFYSISHDLKQPLQIFRRQTRLLKKKFNKELQGPGQTLVENMIQVADHMELLLESILSYYRQEGAENTDERVAISSVINAVIVVMQTAIDEAGAEVVIDGIPDVLVPRGAMTRVVQNLLDNAIKFRGEEPLKIEITALDVTDSWLFTVEDNGSGFDEGNTDKAFAMFKRLHDKDKYPGTGIGLAMCKKIVEEWGGKIWAQSRRGGGTSLHFTLPKNSSTVGGN